MPELDEHLASAVDGQGQQDQTAQVDAASGEELAIVHEEIPFLGMR